MLLAKNKRDLDLANQITNKYTIGTRLDLGGIRAGIRELQMLLKSVNLNKDTSTVISDDTLQRIQIAQKAVKDLNNNYGALNAALIGTGKQGKEVATAFGATASALGDVARRVFVWGALSAAIFGAFQQLKEFYELTIAVNKEMGELRKVVADISVDFAGLQGKAIDLSIEFGTDPIETLNVLKQFAQAGLSVEESLAATKTALLGVNVTGATTQEVFNAIISSARIFNIAIEDTARVIDKIQAVERAFAVDPKDLIASITAIGPAVTTLGGNIDDLFGNIAALGEAARVSGREAGNSLKRVLSQIVSEEGIRALQSIGVKVLASADDYRPLRDILSDLNEKLKNTTQVQKQNLAMTLAQVRQYPKFLALLQNYVRAQDAIEISQNAQGEAFEANQRILDTYSKRLQIADNQTKQFAISALDSSFGITTAFNAIRISVGDFAGSLNEAGAGPIVSLISTVSLLGGAFLALKPILLGRNKDISAATKGLNLFQLANENTVKSVKGLNKAQKASVLSTARWTLGISAAIGALGLLAIGMEYFTREEKRVQAVLKEIRSDIDKFKKSLEKVDFAGLNATDSTSKFAALIDVFEEANETAKNGKIDADALRTAYSELIFKTPFDKLDTSQLETLNNLLKETAVLADSISFRPFFERFQKEFSELPGLLNRAATSIAKDSKRGRDAFDALIKIPGSNTQELTFFGKALQEIADITDGFWDASTSKTKIAEIAKEIGALTQEVIDYEANLRTAGDDHKAFFDTFGRDTVRTNSVEKIRDLLIGMIDIDKALEQASKESGTALSGALIVDPVEQRAKVFAEASELVVASLLQIAKDRGASSSVLAKLSVELGGLVEKAGQAAGATGVLAIELNKVALISGLKSSSASIISGFNAQLRAIAAIGKAGGNISAVYDTAEEGIKAVDETLKRLTRTIGDNETKINTLEIEAQALSTLLAELNDPKNKNIALLDTKAATNIKKEITDIKQEQLVLNAINKVNLSTLGASTTQLLKLKSVLLDIVEVEKARKVVIEGQKDLIGEILSKQVELNNIRVDFSTDALKENDKIFNQILNSQLDYYDNLVSAGILEKEVANEKKNQLIIAENIAKSTRKLDAQLERTATIYSDIRSSASSLGEAFADLLTDQDKFFDTLQSKGSLIKILGQGVDAVAKAIAQNDAKIIAEQIARGSKGIFAEARSELQVIEADIENTIHGLVTNPSIGLAIEQPIVTAAQKAGAILERGIISGAEAMQAVINMLPALLIDGFQQALKFAEGDIAGGIANVQPDSMTGDVSKGVKTALQEYESKNPEIRLQEQSNAMMQALSKNIETDRDLEIANQLLQQVANNTRAQLAEVKTQSADVDAARTNDAMNAFLRQTALRGGQAAAFAIGGSESSQLIQLLSNLGQAAGLDAAGLFGATVGGVGGALLGGLVGRIFGGGPDETERVVEPLRQIEKNTAAMVDKLSPEIINAPANFVSPSGQGFGGGVVINNTFNGVGSGGLNQDTINKLTEQARNVYSRSTKIKSILE